MQIRLEDLLSTANKILNRLSSSQSSRFKNRRNTSRLVVKDNFDQLDGNKKEKKINCIIKNPRFFVNVKEQIKNSVKALSNAKLGSRFNRNTAPRTMDSQRDRNKNKHVISIIRRQNLQIDSRPFSAYPLHRTQTLRISQEKKPPGTANDKYNFKNFSMNTIKWGKPKIAFLAKSNQMHNW